MREVTNSGRPNKGNCVGGRVVFPLRVCFEDGVDSEYRRSSRKDHKDRDRDHFRMLRGSLRAFCLHPIVGQYFQRLAAPGHDYGLFRCLGWLDWR